MLLIILAATAASAAHSAPPSNLDNMPVVNVGSTDSRCAPVSRFEAARRGGKLKPSLLNELPMADVYRAVYRRIGPCLSPVMVRYGVGQR